MAKKRGPKVPNIRTCERLFREQQSRFWKIAKDEEFRHCIDKESFHGEFYDPEKVISNYGRIWSLNTEDFIHSYQKEKPDGYFVIDVSAAGKRHNISPKSGKPRAKMFIHRAVANYFCDKTAVSIYGEDNVEAHHSYSHKKTLPFYKPERNKHNKYWINYWEYLHWTDKDQHSEITQDQKTIPDKYPFIKMWTETNGLGSLEDLPEKQLKELEAICKEKGISLDSVRMIEKKHVNHGIPAQGDIINDKPQKP